MKPLCKFSLCSCTWNSILRKGAQKSTLCYGWKNPAQGLLVANCQPEFPISYEPLLSGVQLHRGWTIESLRSFCLTHGFEVSSVVGRVKYEYSNCCSAIALRCSWASPQTGLRWQRGLSCCVASHTGRSCRSYGGKMKQEIGVGKAKKHIISLLSQIYFSFLLEEWEKGRPALCVLTNTKKSEYRHRKWLLLLSKLVQLLWNIIQLDARYIGTQ